MKVHKGENSITLYCESDNDAESLIELASVLSDSVNIVMDAIDTIKTFWYAHWEKSTSVGKTTKEIIKSLI
jgi:hypothetical protein